MIDRNVQPKRTKQSETRSGFKLGSKTSEASGGGDGGDKWYQKLIKYFPAESLSLYLALEGVLKSATNAGSERVFWMLFALIACMIFNWLFLKRVWSISSNTQVFVSTAALIVYVYALGGVFESLEFYKSWQGTIAVITASAFLSFVEPPRGA